MVLAALKLTALIACLIKKVFIYSKLPNFLFAATLEEKVLCYIVTACLILLESIDQFSVSNLDITLKAEVVVAYLMLELLFTNVHLYVH